MKFRVADIHPCFNCPLPECDDRSRECSLRRLIAAQSRFKNNPDKRRLSLRGKDHARYRIAYREFYAEFRPGRNLRDVVAEVGNC